MPLLWGSANEDDEGLERLEEDVGRLNISTLPLLLVFALIMLMSISMSSLLGSVTIVVDGWAFACGGGTRAC